MVIRGKVSFIGSRSFAIKIINFLMLYSRRSSDVMANILQSQHIFYYYYYFLNYRLLALPKDDDNTADLLIMYSNTSINVDNDEFSFGVVKYRYDALPVTRSSKIRSRDFKGHTFHNFSSLKNYRKQGIFLSFEDGQIYSLDPVRCSTTYLVHRHPDLCEIHLVCRQRRHFRCK